MAAGVSYATLLARMFPLGPAEARRMAADAASDTYRPTLVAAVDRELVPLQRQAAALGGVTSYRQAVLATRVHAYTEAPRAAGQDRAVQGDRARVSVWILLTVSKTGAPSSSGQPGRANPVARFATVRLELIWQRGAWRLDDALQWPGPTPLVEGPLSTATRFEAALGGFADWRPR